MGGMTIDEIVIKLRDMMKRSSRASVNWEAVTPDSSIASLGFDSLSILDLIYDLQQEFGVDFEAQELVSVKTVGQLAAFLQSKQG
jgi:acyl carrier protein